MWGEIVRISKRVWKDIQKFNNLVFVVLSICIITIITHRLMLARLCLGQCLSRILVLNLRLKLRLHCSFACVWDKYGVTGWCISRICNSSICGSYKVWGTQSTLTDHERDDKSWIIIKITCGSRTWWRASTSKSRGWQGLLGWLQSVE